MASNICEDEYSCEISVRSTACKGCDQRIDIGETRVTRNRPISQNSNRRSAQKLHYHPSCLFQLFERLSPNGVVIQSSDDLAGFATLPATDKNILEHLIARHVAGRAAGVGGPVAGPSAGPLTPSDTSTTSTQGNKRARVTASAPILISDDEESDSPVMKQPKLPNLLEGVKIPEGPERNFDECSICLDPPVHPIKLPCGHIFCYLCAKGLVNAISGMASTCSMCRQDIPRGFLESAEVLRKASQELDDTPPMESSSQQDWQWFYEGRNGWWRFEKRNNDELEENLRDGNQHFETMICGNIYVMDLVQFEQYQKDRPQRKRKIRRDLKSMECKGVAGLGKRSWNQGNNG